MKTSYLLYLSLLLGLFTSCEKRELPITLPSRSDGMALQVDMGETYEYQYFVSLETQQIVHISKVKSWDLAFQSGPNEHGIYLNGAKQMAAFATGKTNFDDVNISDTTQIEGHWKVDQASGELDSTAIGNWKDKDQVYIIRLDAKGDQIRKFKIVEEDLFQYKIALGDINATTPTYFTVLKNKDQNFTYFSLDFLSTVPNIEPNKNTWDLQFTQYNYTFYDQNPPLPYVVNGVLLNHYSTFAYHDSLNEYNGINKDFVQNLPYSDKRDIIGYNWKSYDRDLNLYTVEKKYNYIIKNQENHYFKLRFIDFYSPQGVKGSPKFEFKELY